MILISVNIPESYLNTLENLVTGGRFPNRAEAIRTAVRDFIKEEFYRAKSEMDYIEFGAMNTIRYKDNDGDWVTHKVIK
ncbi:hypothetical protein LCGC14_1691820 [marine sediment metagenome]|uniref:Ribbon-helix-helix protein CopG domain-containing protein n=1 Tax=marine sediment metagenome TaxID=412755 RepID=A0A0F9KKN1_9ZZZZ